MEEIILPAILSKINLQSCDSEFGKLGNTMLCQVLDNCCLDSYLKSVT